jgi:hypothetical protein
MRQKIFTVLNSVACSDKKELGSIAAAIESGIIILFRLLIRTVCQVQTKG